MKVARASTRRRAGTILQAAAFAGIESLTLDRAAAHLKDELMPRYAEADLQRGSGFRPEREMLQALIDTSQKAGRGASCGLKALQGDRPRPVVGRRSRPKSLYSLGHVTFEEDAVYDQRDAEGFIRLNALRPAPRRPTRPRDRPFLRHSPRPLRWRAAGWPGASI